jgi:hypothetical protein
MNPYLKRIAIAVLGAAIAATPVLSQAQPPSSPKPDAGRRQCFYANNINNYTTEGERTLYLRVGVADVYRLDLMTDCPELGFRQRIQFTHVGGSSSICSPIDLTIQFRQAGARRLCPVSDMRKLRPDEVAALPKRLRP